VALRVHKRKQDQMLKFIYQRFGRADTDGLEVDVKELCLLVFDKCSKDLAGDHCRDQQSETD
jgi:hypothetical protein